MDYQKEESQRVLWTFQVSVQTFKKVLGEASYKTTK